MYDKPVKYDKPFKTIEEQINYLRSYHQLKITDEEQAKYALMNYSYYDLINGYKDVFMQKDKFFDGENLEVITKFLKVDKEIQNILLKYSAYVESRFKTIFAYYLSMYCGVHQDEYLSSKNYSFKYRPDKDRWVFKSTINSIYKYLNKPIQEIDNPTRHYRYNHNHVPAWILFKNITFNDCTQLFKFIKQEVKNKVISEMLINKEIDDTYRNQFLINSLTIVRKYRNIIAHNLNFVNTRLKRYSIVFSKLEQNKLINELPNKKYSNSPFAMIVCLSYLLDKEMGETFLSDLKSVFERIINKYGDDIFKRYCKISDIPEDILHRLED